MTAARIRSVAALVVIYGAALVVALLVGSLTREEHPMVMIAAADIAATLVVFVGSAALRCASVYDPYWSLAPLVIAAFLFMSEQGEMRALIALVLVWAWGLRLTFNFLRGWPGLQHEDWRYVDLRTATGPLYPLVNLFGIHLLPTAWVYLGCLPLFGIMSSERPLGWLDVPGIVVILAAIVLESRADTSLRRFREAPGRAVTDVLETGVWSRCRHPNYLGEMGVWWGLWLLCLAAQPTLWWTCVGAISITLLFRFISTPMIDRRHVARRPDYARVMRELPAFMPWPRRRPTSD